MMGGQWVQERNRRRAVGPGTEQTEGRERERERDEEGMQGTRKKKEQGRLQAGHGAGMEQQRQLVRHSCGEQSCSYMHPACTECRTAAHLLLCSKGGEVCATECFIFEAVIVSGEREKGGGGRRTAQRMKQQQRSQGAPLRRLVAGNKVCRVGC